MTNPIANPGQFVAEADVCAMRGDERVAAARTQIEMLFARGYGDRIPAESRPLLGAFADEYLNNWLFKAAASDAQHPRFVRNFMPAHDWFGHAVPGARTGGTVRKYATMAATSSSRKNCRLFWMASAMPPAACPLPSTWPVFR